MCYTGQFEGDLFLKGLDYLTRDQPYKERGKPGIAGSLHTLPK